MRRCCGVADHRLLAVGRCHGSSRPSPTSPRSRSTGSSVACPLKRRLASTVTRSDTPGVFADWAKSRHANANITCLDCHLVQPGDQDVAQDHEKYYSRSDLPWGEGKYKMPIASIVTPKDCSRCHPDEATQYSKSKHANTIEIIWKIDPWLNKGMNSDNERKTGCFNCHGTVISIDDNGKIDPATWPNAGVGALIWTTARGPAPPAIRVIASPWPRPASPRPVISVTWGPIIPRSKSTRSPNTARFTTPIRTNTISMRPAAPGRPAWITVRPPARRVICPDPAKSPPATMSPSACLGKPRPP